MYPRKLFVFTKKLFCFRCETIVTSEAAQPLGRTDTGLCTGCYEEMLKQQTGDLVCVRCEAWPAYKVAANEHPWRLCRKCKHDLGGALSLPNDDLTGGLTLYYEKE